MSSIVGRLICPRLPPVKSAEVEPSEEELTQFLDKHNTNLRWLPLECLWLASVVWTSKVPRIRPLHQLNGLLLEDQFFDNDPRQEDFFIE